MGFGTFPHCSAGSEEGKKIKWEGCFSCVLFSPYAKYFAHWYQKQLSHPKWTLKETKNHVHWVQASVLLMLFLMKTDNYHASLWSLDAYCIKYGWAWDQNQHSLITVKISTIFPKYCTGGHRWLVPQKLRLDWLQIFLKKSFYFQSQSEFTSPATQFPPPQHRKFPLALTCWGGTRNTQDVLLHEQAAYPLLWKYACIV